MHQHMAHPPGPDPAPTLLDNISDTLLNAFARVRKPDERFVQMRESIDKFEESLTGIERTWGRGRARATGESVYQKRIYFCINTTHRTFLKISPRIITTWQYQCKVLDS